MVGTALDGAIGIDAIGDGCCGAEIVDIDYSRVSVAVVITAVGLSVRMGISPRLRRLERSECCVLHVLYKCILTAIPTSSSTTPGGVLGELLSNMVAICNLRGFLEVKSNGAGRLREEKRFGAYYVRNTGQSVPENQGLDSNYWRTAPPSTMDRQTFRIPLSPEVQFAPHGTAYGVYSASQCIFHPSHGKARTNHKTTLERCRAGCPCRQRENETSEDCIWNPPPQIIPAR